MEKFKETCHTNSSAYAICGQDLLHVEWWDNLMGDGCVVSVRVNRMDETAETHLAAGPSKREVEVALGRRVRWT